jgi:hypothetical protein
VRRGDKLRTEANLINLKKYFEVADIYFEAYRKVNKIKTLTNRTVFIMSDDNSVFNEAKLK